MFNAYKKIIRFVFPTGTRRYLFAKKVQAQLENKKAIPKTYDAWDKRSDKQMHREIFSRQCAAFFHLESFNRNMRPLRKLKNIHKGERCFIVGTAPSLSLEDLQAIKGEFSFGVNSVIACYPDTDWRPDYYAVVDSYAFKSYLENNRVYGGSYSKSGSFFHCRISPLTSSEPQYSCLVDYSNHDAKNIKKNRIRFSRNAAVCVYDAFTVVNMAIQIAAYMGFNTIILLGVDCQYSANKRHFVESEMDDLQKNNDFEKVVELSKKGFVAARGFADKRHIQILNASRGGKLDVFPLVNLDDILLKKEKNEG